MSRGTALSTLRTLLKAELRDAQQTNSVIDTEYNYALASKQKDLALAYDWPFLQHDWDLACAAGSRYLNIPTTDVRGASVTINFERPVQVSRLHGSYYREICYGIGNEQYNLFEGTTEKADPIQAWQLVTNANEASNPAQVEIWPSPATAQSLRFRGQRNVLALASNSDTADLDDYLLVYMVAADYLALRGQPNAPVVLRKAQEHLIKLRASYPTDDEPVIWGRNTLPRSENVKLIAIA